MFTNTKNYGNFVERNGTYYPKQNANYYKKQNAINKRNNDNNEFIHYNYIATELTKEQKNAIGNFCYSIGGITNALINPEDMAAGEKGASIKDFASYLKANLEDLKKPFNAKTAKISDSYLADVFAFKFEQTEKIIDQLTKMVSIYYDNYTKKKVIVEANRSAISLLTRWLKKEAIRAVFNWNFYESNWGKYEGITKINGSKK